VDTSDLNLKLLHIFIAVVEMNGIANAQAILNKDASTISRAIARLEEQMGLRLCERGRQGFSLTGEGERVYRESVDLFAALRSFSQNVAALGSPRGGQLKLSLIDNIVSDPACPVPAALAKLNQRYGTDLEANIYISSPGESERQLLERRADVAVGIFDTHQDFLNYQPLYQETDYLYCAKDSALGQLILSGASDDEIYQSLLLQDFVTRKFLKSSDLSILAAEHRGGQMFCSNLEGIVMLILSGRYVGFVPAHYVSAMSAAAQLLPVLTAKIEHHSQLQAAWPVTSGLRPLVAEFLQLLKSSRNT